MSLGFCIDSHGNGDGELNAGELIGALEHLHENEMISDETVADLMEMAPEGVEDGDVVDWETAGEII